MSRVELARRARKEILDRDWPLSDAAVEALGLLERRPEAGHLLRGRLRGLRSLRVGTYRIIHQVDDDQRLVRVLAVHYRTDWTISSWQVRCWSVALSSQNCWPGRSRPTERDSGFC